MRRLFPWLLITAAFGITSPETHCTAQDPAGDQGLTQMLQQIEEERRLEDETRELTQQLANNPTDTAALFRRAKLWLQRGNVEAALADLQQATAGRDGEVLAKAGVLLGEYVPDKALALLDHGMRSKPGNAELLAARGYVRSLTSDLDGALVDLDAALAIRPDARTLAIKGNLLMQREKYLEAIECFTKSIEHAGLQDAIANETPFAQVFFDRGFCFKAVGNFDAAVEDYTRSLQLAPENLAAVYERGESHQRAGHFADAVRDYESCLQPVPEADIARLQLSWLYATCPDANIRNGERALELAADLCDPVTCTAAEPLAAIAAAYAERGDFSQAEKYQQRALALTVFSPASRDAYTRRLHAIQSHQAIREGTAPLELPAPEAAGSTSHVSLEDALVLPADILGMLTLQEETFSQLTAIAGAGGKINLYADGTSEQINATNAAAIDDAVAAQHDITTMAVRRRGFATLSETYTAHSEGDCDGWGLGDVPTLITQNDFAVEITQGTIQHVGVVVENTVVFRHDYAIGLMIVGTIADDGSITFITPNEPGIYGTATERCTLTLRPAQLPAETLAEAIAGRGVSLQQAGDERQAIAEFDRAYQVSPKPEFMAIKAITLATCHDAELRDGAKAVEAALLAEKLLKGAPDLLTVSALVVAHAEAGNLTAAIRYQRQFIALLPPDEREMAEHDLATLEAGHVFHDAPW